MMGDVRFYDVRHFYDLRKSMFVARRTRAVEQGAVEHTREQMVQFMRSCADGGSQEQANLFGGE